ncbi:hypothetical protein Tco_1319426 [Tanacetum coccineum]
MKQLIIHNHINKNSILKIRHPTLSVPQNAYHSPIISPQPQAEFPQLDSGLAVLVFLPGDDLISCLNKAVGNQAVLVTSSQADNTVKSESRLPERLNAETRKSESDITNLSD